MRERPLAAKGRRLNWQAIERSVWSAIRGSSPDNYSVFCGFSYKSQPVCGEEAHSPGLMKDTEMKEINEID